METSDMYRQHYHPHCHGMDRIVIGMASKLCFPVLGFKHWLLAVHCLSLGGTWSNGLWPNWSMVSGHYDCLRHVLWAYDVVCSHDPIGLCSFLASSLTADESALWFYCGCCTVVLFCCSIIMSVPSCCCWLTIYKTTCGQTARCWLHQNLQNRPSTWTSSIIIRHNFAGHV